MIITKRNGTREKFQIEKIIKAVNSAFQSEGKQMPEYLIGLIRSLFSQLEGELNVEDVQNKVEELLMNEKLFKVAKSYILYRESHKQARFIKNRIDYMNKYSSGDSNAATASETDANANVTMKNIANLEGEVYKTTNRIIQRQRMKDKLNELFPEVAKQYERDLASNIIYAHDESQTPALKNYCMACTLYPLMLEGTGNIDGVTPSPPNDIQSFSGQVTNLLFLLSSQVRGAVALGDYIVVLNYYVIKEFGEKWYNKLDSIVTSEHCNKSKTILGAIRKGMKQFIYGINQPAGNRNYNSPFSNLNFFDKYYFKALFKDFYYPDGTQPEWEAIDTLQRIFVILLRELRLQKPLTFPVTSFCVLHDNNDLLDQEYKDFIAEEWSKGSSFFLYLSNNPNSVSSCCRVLNEIQENTFSSTIGLTGIMTGSTNVITLNLNRIIQDWAREYSKDGLDYADLHTFYAPESGFKNYLVDILERIYKYQIAYKSMIYDMEDAGMYSSSNAGYIFTKKLYCTIGVIGYCEAAQFLGLEITNNSEYKRFLKFIFNVIQEENRKHSIHDKKRPFIFNTEAIPGENLAVKLYEKDKSDGYYVPEDQNLYSSYFFKQWDGNISILDKLKLHGKEINQYCGGGQACHLHLEEHPTKEQFIKLIDFTVKEGVNYWTVNVPMSECKDCGYVVNAPIKECPKCKGKNIDWWVRIIGYLRPISSYSMARQIEADKRVYNKV
jgi:ribonucleoside-triphosphate reductase